MTTPVSSRCPLRPFVAALAFLVLSSCGGGVKMGAIRSMNEVAVVSIGAPTARDIVHREFDRFTYDDRQGDLHFSAAMERTHEYLFGEFATTVPFSLSDETPILQSGSYQTLTVTEGRMAALARRQRSTSFATPKQYRSFDAGYLQDDALQKLYAALPSSPDGVLLATTRYRVLRDDVKHEEREERIERAKSSEEEFKEVMKSSPALTDGDRVSLDIKARTTIEVLDRRGNTVLEMTQRARSETAFTFTYGEGWNTAQTKTAMLEATNEALAEVTASLKEALPTSP